VVADKNDPLGRVATKTASMTFYRADGVNHRYHIKLIGRCRHEKCRPVFAAPRRLKEFGHERYRTAGTSPQ